MPRTENQSNYHYKAKIRDKNKNEEFYTKYFLTMNDASTFFGAAKSTCYDRLYPPDKTAEYKNLQSNRWRFIKNYEIDYFYKLEPPVPKYQKIMVHFD